MKYKLVERGNLLNKSVTKKLYAQPIYGWSSFESYAEQFDFRTDKANK